MNARKSLLEEHWSETSLSIVLLIGTGVAWASGKLSTDTTVVIDVITATLAISVAIIKDYSAKLAESISIHQHLLESRTGEISAILENLSGRNLEHAIQIVDSSLESVRLIPQGVLRFDPSSYYNELTGALRKAKKGCHVSAVSSMPIERWDSDPRQLHYLEENVKAAKRGVVVHRVFIIEKTNMNGSHGDHARKIIFQQRIAKIKVSIVWRESIKHDPALYDDFVLFREESVVFRDEHEKVDPTRVQAGFLVSDQKRIKRYKGVFQSLSETYCVEESVLDELLGHPVQ